MSIMSKYEVLSKHKVFITRKIPDIGIKLLQKHCEVKVYPQDHPITKPELQRGVQWCNALLCLLTDKIDQDIIEINLNLKIITNYATGYDNIDLKYATKKRIPVANVTSILSADAVAEHTFALMFTLAKRIVEADQYVRAGKYHFWQPLLLEGTELTGKILGIVGLGRIGSGVAERAHAMGMRLIYYDVIANAKFERHYHAKRATLPQLLQRADFVTLHVPLLPTTHHLIGKKELSLMKKTAYLINTARGPVIDEQALVHALQQKQLAGAGLDVYEHEPQLTKGLLKLPNVVLTPHTASSTVESRNEMAVDAARNIITALAGQRPPMLLNPQVYE